ncbi:hypothetical protein C5S30_03735 [ANME-1 cluster archaeon GoMg4]|nr:hypothetical protein [ANME-1 cluster archaeon GoMg4]
MRVLCLIAILIVVGSSILASQSFLNNQKQGMTGVTINEIRINPTVYEGKTVTIKGEYRGWQAEGEGSGPPVTRSDWVIKDDTGWIYVTGRSPRLDPIKDIGTPIFVVGTVEIKNSNVYIWAQDIKIGGKWKAKG